MRHVFWLFVLSLFFPIGLRAETLQQRLDGLQHGIDSASELGRFDRVQALRLDLAREAAGAKRYALAARQYELLLAARPGKRERVKLFVELARMRRLSENFGGAISAYQDALHDDPKNWDANFELAQTNFQIDLNVAALSYYQRSLKIKPKSVDVYLGMAAVYQKQGFLNKAIKEYEKALKIQPRPEIYLAMADCYLRQDNMDKAADILQQGKAVLPWADYDARLGDIYHRRGDLIHAASSWEDSLKVDNKRDDIRLKLAMLYDRLGRRADTDRMLKKLEGSYPKSPLVHFLRAWIHYDRGDRETARLEAQRVERLAPTELVKHYNDRLLLLLNK